MLFGVKSSCVVVGAPFMLVLCFVLRKERYRMQNSNAQGDWSVHPMLVPRTTHVWFTLFAFSTKRPEVPGRKGCRCRLISRDAGLVRVYGGWKPHKE